MSDLSTRISEIQMLHSRRIDPNHPGYGNCRCGFSVDLPQDHAAHVAALIIEAIRPNLGKVESAIFAALQRNPRMVQRIDVKWSEIEDLARAAVSAMGIEEKP